MEETTINNITIKHKQVNLNKVFSFRRCELLRLNSTRFLRKTAENEEAGEDEELFF